MVKAATVHPTVRHNIPPCLMVCRLCFCFLHPRWIWHSLPWNPRINHVVLNGLWTSVSMPSVCCKLGKQTLRWFVILVFYLQKKKVSCKQNMQNICLTLTHEYFVNVEIPFMSFQAIAISNFFSQESQLYSVAVMEVKVGKGPLGRSHICCGKGSHFWLAGRARF